MLIWVPDVGFKLLLVLRTSKALANILPALAIRNHMFAVCMEELHPKTRMNKALSCADLPKTFITSHSELQDVEPNLGQDLEAKPAQLTQAFGLYSNIRNPMCKNSPKPESCPSSKFSRIFIPPFRDLIILRTNITFLSKPGRNMITLQVPTHIQNQHIASSHMQQQRRSHYVLQTAQRSSDPFF
ncbi:hypothetical protein ONS96_010044 [Cadophora gregata f. sp. sojae]|nr:hypothetical protein ONS96_010044 [Cadophora gregata f. sp. sojae]